MFDRTSLHISLLLWGFIFSVIAAICMFMSKNFDKEKRKWLLSILFVCASLLLGDVFAWRFRGDFGLLAWWGVRISNFIVFLCSDILLILYNGYMSCCIFEKHLDRRKKRIIMVYGIGIVGIILVIISQFTNLYYYFDDANVYHRNALCFLAMLLPILGMILDFTVLVQYRKKMNLHTFVALVSYIALPFFAAVIQMFYYGVSLINLAICISVILLFVVAMMEQNENLARKEREAAELRISVLISQIAPHFIYNTLTTIQELCETQPKEASKTVEDFAQYLRGNLESVNQKEPVLFEQELKHVRYYLSIEKRRFGNRIHVEYDIQETSFLIPALTLQPIVENAVKHGLCKKKGGGTIWIQTRSKQDGVYLTVIDDGAGFDVKSQKFYKNNGIGLKNVTKRLENMCNGSLEVESKENKGTKVTIKIPYQNDKNI